MLNAERINPMEQQSISNAVVNVFLDASFNNKGLQSSATTFSVAATKSWIVVKRPWMFRLPDGCLHWRTMVVKQLNAAMPNKVANV